MFCGHLQTVAEDTCSHSTSASGALEVVYDNALYKYTFDIGIEK